MFVYALLKHLKRLIQQNDLEKVELHKGILNPHIMAHKLKHKNIMVAFGAGMFGSCFKAQVYGLLIKRGITKNVNFIWGSHDAFMCLSVPPRDEVKRKVGRNVGDDAGSM